MKKFLHLLSEGFCIVCIILIVLFVGGRILGYKTFVVTSGSMSPEYKVGTVVYTKYIDPRKLKSGDDISFRFDEDTIATHRIRRMYFSKSKVQTYGINNLDHKGNPINDAKLVDFDYIEGRVEHSIPKIGYIYLLVNSIR